MVKKSDYTWEKQKSRKDITSLDEYIFDGNIDSIISLLTSLKESYSHYEDLYISCNRYYENIDFILSGIRLETDEEFNKRIALQNKILEKEKAEKKKKEEKEKREYERLKKKFEKNNVER